MGFSYYRRSREMVERGIDPRSLYPRCDLCAEPAVKKREKAVNPSDPLMPEPPPVPRPMSQYGRWWMHGACHDDPETRELASAKLPVLDYGAWRKLGDPLDALDKMRARLAVWSMGQRDNLREVAEEIGAARMRKL